MMDLREKCKTQPYQLKVPPPEFGIFPPAVSCPDLIHREFLTWNYMVYWSLSLPTTNTKYEQL